MMRSLFALPLLVACTSASAPDASYNSVRERLASSPTQLLAQPAASSGSISATRYGVDGWHPGTAAFSIANGEIVATVDGAGAFEMRTLDASVDPIEIPPDVFGKPARLQDLRMQLASRPTAMTAWADADDATVTATIDLDVSWSIAIADTVLPLSTQHLRALPVELSITGGGDHVDAIVSLHASGELWNWAGLVKLTDLEVTLDTATVD